MQKTFSFHNKSLREDLRNTADVFNRNIRCFRRNRVMFPEMPIRHALRSGYCVCVTAHMSQPVTCAEASANRRMSSANINRQRKGASSGNKRPALASKSW